MFELDNAYRIVGNFGEVFNSAVRQIFIKSPNFNPQILVNACMRMALSIQITKFKIRQYQLAAVSPNLMLAKVSCYTVLSIYIKSYK